MTRLTAMRCAWPYEETGPSMSARIAGLAAAIALSLAGCGTQTAGRLAADPASSGYGIVAVKSAHPFADTSVAK
jgi:hypothetical protein